MTTHIPVVWLNFHPEAMARFYWDQQMIEDLFAGKLWRVPGGFTFAHYRTEPGDEWPDEQFVVAVIPGRHNAHFVDKINLAMQRYQSVLYIITGDEEGIFPWGRLNHRQMKVWAMGARPDRNGNAVDRPLGSGYPPHFTVTAEADIKDGDVFLAAQDTHLRRHQCFDVLDQMDRANEATGGPLAIVTHRSPGFTEGLTPAEYADEMSAAKIAPSPSGPESPDSFRLYEALEAGCIPVADGATPHGPVPGYWPYVFWGPVPFPVVADWSELPLIVEAHTKVWPRTATRIAAWWQRWKRQMAYTLDADVRELRPGDGPDYETPSDLITVVLPTCPIPSHPDTAMIEEVVRSIREQLPTAEVIIACDGIRPSFKDRADDYEEHLQRLVRLCSTWNNVAVTILDDWGHQSGGTRAALELATTPLMLFVEHDTPLTGDIDWRGLCDELLNGDVHMIRLSHETAVHPDHRQMALDNVPEHIDTLDESTGSWALSDAERVQVRRFGPRQVPLIRTTQWSQRPHLTTTAFYRDRVMPNFAPEDKTYIEWVMHSAAQNGIEHGMEQQWDRWRIVIYAPDGGNIQRSLHLDGRAGASTEDSILAFEQIKERAAAPESEPAS